MSTKELKLEKTPVGQILIRLTPYIFYFAIFSFLGWIAETLFCYIKVGELLKRGFLYGPICPIYGYGSLILMLYFYKSKNIKHNYFKLFVLFILIFSFFEYFVGFALEAVFSDRWWDYSDDKYNLNGRITILNSFLWGVATLFFSKYIYPLTNFARIKFINKLPNVVKFIIDFAILAIIFIDTIFSCIRYLH